MGKAARMTSRRKRKPPTSTPASPMTLTTMDVVEVSTLLGDEHWIALDEERRHQAQDDDAAPERRRILPGHQRLHRCGAFGAARRSR